MKKYLQLLKKILNKGELTENRTKIDTKSIFGASMRIKLQNTFPILTTKYIHWKSVVHELLWFLSGSENISYLRERNIKIWDKWADDNLNVGKMYGAQWVNWNNKINQVDKAIDLIKNTPNSRRIIISAWNPEIIPDDTTPPKDNPAKGLMALAPCHIIIQFKVNKKELSCIFYQRSVDVFLGLPFNIASYALFTHMIAQQCNLVAKEVIFMGGDCHLYVNHIQQAKIQINRKPYPLPQLKILTKPKFIYDYKYEDFVLENYTYHPKLSAEIAV
jgi:thymidylate synthase